MADIYTSLEEITSVHASEMSVKNAAIAEAQAALQAATRDLALQRRETAEAQQADSQLEETKYLVVHGERCLAAVAAMRPPETETHDDLESWEKDQSKAGFDQLDQARQVALLDWGEFSPAHLLSTRSMVPSPSPSSFPSPCSQSLSHMDMDSEEEKLVHLRWLSWALRRQTSLWYAHAQQARDRGQAHAAQCRRVVALCCNVEESKVEDILDDLVVAVDSDGPSVDLARLTTFMRVVHDAPEGNGPWPESSHQPTSPSGPRDT